jgi:hypothetical protein
MSDSAPQSQAADTRRRDDARWNSEPERMCGVIDIAPQRPAADENGFLLRIHAHVTHRRQVDHQAVIAHTQAHCVVAAAAYREKQLLLAREVDGGLHICHVNAPRDETGSPVDHPVVDLSRVVVLRIARGDELAAQIGPERSNCVVTQHDSSGYSNRNRGIRQALEQFLFPRSCVLRP